MAHVIPNAKPQDPKAYNVDQAVGAIAPNVPGDVKLVQYMLKHYYGPQALSLKVDGWIGSTTIGWIRRFQEEAKRAAVNVLVDGRIDPARGQISSISRTVYTILVLNSALRERNPAAHAALPSHVPLNSTPKSKPSQQKPKKILVVYLFGWRPPTDVYVFYVDGTTEHWGVQGSVQFPPGTPVMDRRHPLART
jgi:hypothetical protein